MKKITLLLLSFLVFQYGNAQDTCATALTVTVGTTTVGTINGTVPTPVCSLNGPVTTNPAGEWYVYTALVNGVVNISSNLPQNTGGDTRVQIYTGTCSTLECHGGNDDVDGTNYLSDVTFAVTVGTSYYIAWDNRWSSTGFDFVLSETAVTCPTGVLPYSEDFDNEDRFAVCYEVEDLDANGNSWIQQFLDLDGDTVDEDFATNGSNGATAKNDWLISPPINLVAGVDYNFSFKFNGADGQTNAANESLEILLIDAPTSTANILTTLHTQTGIVQTGVFADVETMATTINPAYSSTVAGTYYIAFHATSPPNSAFLLLFDYSVNQTLSIDEYHSNIFKHFYNKDSDVLTLDSSNLPFDNIKLFNILGQEVLNKSLSQTSETISLAELKDGVYFAKVNIEGQMNTVKLLKQ